MSKLQGSPKNRADISSVLKNIQCLLIKTSKVITLDTEYPDERLFNSFQITPEGRLYIVDGKGRVNEFNKSSFNILGSKTIEELEDIVGDVGDAYIVGGDLYVWSAVDGTWANVGKFSGDDGSTPEIGVNGNWWTNGSDTGYPSRGERGVSITNISLTNTVGYTDIYTITMSEGANYTFEVENGIGLDYNWLGTQLGIKREDEANFSYVDLKGVGISSITYDSSAGIVDTYKINYTDSTNSYFDVTNAKQLEMFRSGNDVRWRYVGDTTSYSLLNTLELGTATMTFAQRIALTGVIDGAKVFQTDGAKGEYQYVSGKWYFIGNKLTKQISSQYYTLQIADIGYLLEFTLDIPGIEVEVTIPNGIFADAHIIDIIQGGASKVKFLDGSGMVVEIDSLYPNRRTYNKITEAKIRFKSASSATVTGGLE